jgi:hypothetical protein
MRIPRLLPLLITGAFAACGTLYNQQREDTAKTAQKAFSDATLADTFKAERDQNAEILDRELKIAQRESFARRDLSITNIIKLDAAADSRAKLQDKIEARIKDVMGAPETEPGKRAGNLAILRERDVALAMATDSYLVVRTADDPKPRCIDGTVTGTFDVSSDASAAWKDYVTACGNVLDIRKTIASDQGVAEVSAATRELVALSSARDDVIAQVDRLTKEFKAEAKKLEDARTAATGTDLAKRAEDLQDKLKKVTLPSNAQLAKFGVDDARAIAAVEWLGTQKNYVDKVLEAAASGATTPPPDVDDAIQVASILPAIKADLDKALRFPRVSVLILESERLRLERDRMKNAASRIDERIALHSAKRDLLLREYDLLNRARDTLINNKEADDACAAQLAEKKTTLAKLPLMEAPLACRGQIIGALVQYATAWTIGRAPAEAAEWRLINVDYESALDNSESALLQWNNLIAVPLDAIVANAGTGIRPDAVARLIGDAELAVAVAVP